jgi:hypothetical protein
MLQSAMAMVSKGIEWLSDKFAGISAAWSAFTAGFANIKPFALLGKAADWLIDKLNMIPGINIESRFSAPVNDLPKGADTAVKMPAALPSALTNGIEKPALASRQTLAAKPAGGVINRISSATNNNSKRSVHIDQLNVTSGGTVRGDMLANELEMAAG